MNHFSVFLIVFFLTVFFLTVFFLIVFFWLFFFCSFFFCSFFLCSLFFVRFFLFVFLFVFFICFFCLFFYSLSAFYRKRTKKEIIMMMMMKNDSWIFSVLIKTVFFIFDCHVVFIFSFCAWSSSFHYFVYEIVCEIACEIACDVIYEIAWQQCFSSASTICLLLKIDFDVLFFDEKKISKYYFVWILFFCFLFFVISSKGFFFLLNLKKCLLTFEIKMKSFVFFFKIKISKAVIMTAFVCLFDCRISKWSNKSMKKKILKKNYKYIKMWWRRQKSNKKKIRIDYHHKDFKTEFHKI